MSSQSPIVLKFKAQNKKRREIRAENKRLSTTKLVDNAVVFESKNDGWSLYVEVPGGTVLFAPSTGLFQRLDETWGRGIEQLLKLAGVEEPI